MAVFSGVAICFIRLVLSAIVTAMATSALEWFCCAVVARQRPMVSMQIKPDRYERRSLRVVEVLLEVVVEVKKCRLAKALNRQSVSWIDGKNR
jgi:hypothetical protein